MPNAARISSTLILRSAATVVPITVPSLWFRRSDDVGFRLDITGREAPVREDVERHLGLLTREPLGEEVSDRGRLLEAMAGETTGAPEAPEGAHGPQARLM